MTAPKRLVEIADEIGAALAMTDAERQKRYRDRLRGGPARVPKPCGTMAAYRRHQRAGEPPCDLCRRANADYQRDYQRRSADGL